MPDIFPGARFVGDAKVSGRLYDLGAYPGLVIDKAGSAVAGEVYEVDDEILNRLDEIEASGSYYVRRRIEVSVGDDKMTCWVYEPSPELYSLRTLITSGDWIEYAKTKTEWPADV